MRLATSSAAVEQSCNADPSLDSASHWQMAPLYASPSDFARVWIVVPAYNEAGRLRSTLRDVLSVCPNVIVVDDGSSDGTDEVARTLPVWILRHSMNCGQGAALQTGIDFAIAQGAEVIVTFDADGQHQSRDLAALIAPIMAGTAEVCLGSRFLGRCSHIPSSRRILLKLATLFTRLTSRLAVTDTHNGLRAMSRASAQRLRLDHCGMAHASELLDGIRRYRIRYREVPVTILYSPETLKKGQSVWNAFGIVLQLAAGKFIR